MPYGIINVRYEKEIKNDLGIILDLLAGKIIMQIA